MHPELLDLQLDLLLDLLLFLGQLLDLTLEGRQVLLPFEDLPEVHLMHLRGDRGGEHMDGLKQDRQGQVGIAAGQAIM